jgi:hypothetical protein
MENHEVLAPALQKYYSALKALYDFGQQGDFFDDVSNLDKFFSEFRNITFVVQKAVKTEEDKAFYSRLRTKYLAGETLKWFVEARNKTTKEQPFDLKKELRFDLYSSTGVVEITDSRLVVNFEESFADVLDFIRTEFLRKYKLNEISFSVRIIFSESGSEVELYPRIKSGLIQMNEFIGALEDHFPCKCQLCTELKRKNTDLFFKVQAKELLFTRDYALETENNLTQGDIVEMYLSKGEGDPAPISTLRLSLDNMLFGKSNGCLSDLFLKFVSMHIVSFQLQEHQIMPVFMMVYSDYTYRMIPFVATTKATFYRKVIEITEMSDFCEVDAVFYCGEYYVYDLDQFSEINEKPYSERIPMAKAEVLAFYMIINGGNEMEIHFDEQRIDDMQYIAKQIQEADWTKDAPAPFDWLNPIRQKLNSKQSADIREQKSSS